MYFLRCFYHLCKTSGIGLCLLVVVQCASWCQNKWASFIVSVICCAFLLMICVFLPMEIGECMVRWGGCINATLLFVNIIWSFARHLASSKITNNLKSCHWYQLMNNLQLSNLVDAVSKTADRAAFYRWIQYKMCIFRLYIYLKLLMNIAFALMC